MNFSILILFHLIFLHKTLRSSKLLCHLFNDKINFFPYFFVKDMFNILIFIIFFILLLNLPFLLGDVEIFITANSLNRPKHIVPE